MFKRIVVGCDGTAEGRDAVALGAAIVSATGAGLSLLGVYPTSFLPIQGATDRRTLRRQAEATLRHDRNLLAPHALIATVTDNSVPRALRHYAERRHAGLVVIGSARSAPTGHVRIGRRGRQLLHDAPFALALAARGFHERERELRTVGVGYDGGPEAKAALALASDLARAAGATLLVRRVVEDQVPALSTEEWMVLEDWTHVWESARKAALAETEQAVSSLDLRVEASATVGDPGYDLRALSELVDLVVVGSRRWGTVARLVSGGVGETLVADASSSVLIVPRPPAAQDQRFVGQHSKRPAVA